MNQGPSEAERAPPSRQWKHTAARVGPDGARGGGNLIELAEGSHAQTPAAHLSGETRVELLLEQETAAGGWGCKSWVFQTEAESQQGQFTWSRCFFFNGMYLSRYENLSYTQTGNQRVALKDVKGAIAACQ